MSDSVPANPASPPALTAKDIGATCLVSGGAGYVGSALVKRLVASGCQVISLDATQHSHPDQAVTCIQADLRDHDAIVSACAGVDTIFHTAALIKPLEIYRPSLKRLVYDVNVVGTQNLLDAAKRQGATSLVHTSTFNVVLDRELNDSDESLPYATRSRDLYTLTKIEAEKAVLAANSKDGLRTCALRPGGVWGSDTRSIMIRSVLVEVAKNNFKVLIGNGKATIDNTHVENLVDAQVLAAKALRAADASAGGEAFFITDDEPVNGLEWFRPLVEGVGEKFPSFRLPGGMMKLVGRLMELIHFLGGPEPTLNRRGIRNLTESASFRIDKARRILGYSPRYQRSNGIPELLPASRDYLEELRSA